MFFATFQGGGLDQENSRIFLPKLGWIRYRNSREVISEVKTSLAASLAVSGMSVSRQNTKSLSLNINGWAGCWSREAGNTI